MGLVLSMLLRSQSLEYPLASTRFDLVPIFQNVVRRRIEYPRAALQHLGVLAVDVGADYVGLVNRRKAVLDDGPAELGHQTRGVLLLVTAGRGTGLQAR